MTESSTVADAPHTTWTNALERFEDRTRRQGGWTAWLWTGTLAAFGAACLYGGAWLQSIERVRSPAIIEVAPPKPLGPDDEGQRGQAYDFGVEAEPASLETEAPVEPPPLDATVDRLTDLALAEAERAGPDGGPIGNSINGDSISDRPRRNEPQWRLDYPTGSKEQYARVLDYFRIKLAAFENGRCRAAEGFARDARTILHQLPPARRFFQPQDAERRAADRELLAGAGIAVSESAILCQYIPDELTEKLRAQETAFAGRPLDRIAATHFGVRPAGDHAFETYVIEQTAR